MKVLLRFVREPAVEPFSLGAHGALTGFFVQDASDLVGRAGREAVVPFAEVQALAAQVQLHGRPLLGRAGFAPVQFTDVFRGEYGGIVLEDVPDLFKVEGKGLVLDLPPDSEHFRQVADPDIGVPHDRGPWRCP